MNVEITKMEDLLYWYKAHVLRVIDGDTIVFSEIDLGFEIVLKNKHGRLLGIDTPELKASDPEVKALAYEAKDYVAVRLTDQDVIIKSVEVDNFGRILVKVYLAEEYVNDTLIAEGYAVVFDK